MYTTSGSKLGAVPNSVAPASLTGVPASGTELEPPLSLDAPPAALGVAEDEPPLTIDAEGIAFGAPPILAAAPPVARVPPSALVVEAPPLGGEPAPARFEGSRAEPGARGIRSVEQAAARQGITKVNQVRQPALERAAVHLPAQPAMIGRSLTTNFDARPKSRRHPRTAHRR